MKARLAQPGFCFFGAVVGPLSAIFTPQQNAMRDKKDHATLDLVGFDQAAIDDDCSSSAAESASLKRQPRQRATASRAPQEQLELLAPTDATGLPVWQRDEGLDLTGLPVWAAA